MSAMWPDYLGTLPTWLAFGAAAVASVATWRALRRERSRDAHREELERRQQADLVAAWVNHDYQGNDWDAPSWAIKIVNRSNLPIFDVQAEARLTDGGKESMGSTQKFVVIPPDSAVESECTDPLGSMLAHEDMLVSLTFRDCAGANWVRDFDGTLSVRPPQD